MRRLCSDSARVSGSFRLLAAVALAASMPFAAAQRGGSMDGGQIAGASPGHIGGGYAGHIGGFGGRIGSGAFGRSFAGSSAPNFVSTFGPHSITGTPGANFVTGGIRFAPDYAASWGVAHPVWRGEGNAWNRRRDRDRDRDRDRRSGFGGYGYGYPFLPVYSGWPLMPSDLGYQEVGAANPDNSESEASTTPGYNAPAPPQDEYRPPYAAPESEYAPPPPSPAAPAKSSTVLESEPALTLIFKDGHQQAIRNYALTGDAVIVLDKAASGRQERIPLADLNLPATEQAAQAAGLDFSPPQTRE